MSDPTLEDLKHAVEAAIKKYGANTAVHVDAYEVIRVEAGSAKDNFIDLNDFHSSPIR